MLSPIDPFVPIRLIRQLVDIEIDVPIKAYVRAIWPNDSGISYIGRRLQGSFTESQVRKISRVAERWGFSLVDVDSVVLGHEHVYVTQTVAGESVGVPASLA